MKPYDGDKSQCPCCKECIDCNTGFQKVVDLKNAGLVIYRHTTRTEDLNKDTGIIEFATKTTEDVFILHNTKNMDITSADYLPEIAQNKITCPRCRQIIEHAQKLLKKVPTINKNDVKGICEHCRTRDAPCFECEEVVKKFVANRAESSENKKEKVKQWLSKIKYLLKDAVVENETGKGRARAHSELSIDQLCRDVPETGRKLEVKQMFHTDSKDFIGTFPPTIEKRKKLFAHFPQLEKVEQPIVFINQPGTGKSSTFRPTVGLQDKMYGSDVDSEDLRAMFRPPLTEEEKQDKAKKTPQRENIPPVPFQSEEDFKSVKDSTTSFERIIRPKSHQKTNEEIETDKKRFIQVGKISHRNEVPQQIGTSHDVKQQVWPTKSQKAELENKRSISSIKSARRLHGKIVESDKIRKYHSEEALLTTIVGVTEEMIKQDFSYVFPKMLSPDKKKLKRQKSSSELIKDTQDMIQAKAEEEKKRLEEERKKKLEEEERKRLAREEKKKLLEAKKKADEERKRLEAIEKKSQMKVEQPKIEPDKKDTVKKEKVTPTVSTATTKSKTKDSDKESKPKEPKEPPKPKEPKEPKEPKVPKEPKEPKVPKEPKEPKEPKVDKNALKADKDAEKAKKEQEKKEKEDRLKKEKEEKERLKKEKEDQLRKEKEMKEKEKGSNTRDKDKDDKLKKEKEAAAAKQKELDRARQEKLDAEKREREEAKNRLRSAKEDETAVKPEPEKPKVAKKVEEPTTKELKVKSVKVHRPSSDDLILQLVKLKQSDGGRVKPRRLADLNLTSKDVKNHKVYHRQRATGDCIMCTDSDIELDAESLDAYRDGDKMAEIIIGAKLFKYKPPLIDKHIEQNVPIFFQSTFDDTKHVAEPNESATSPHAEHKRSPVIQAGKQAQKTEQEVAKGVIRYALSDRTFIEKGWTMLPTEKVVRKMNVYRMRPAHPEFDWFEHHKNKRQMQYDTGEKLAEFDDNGRGRWFYRNGRMALDYYDAEELNAQQRFVIFSSGEPDERGRSQPYTLLATFDYLGNGIVFDHSGKIRLKYNQTEGVVLDRSIGPVSHWKWHTLNDPPVLQQVMIDTQMAHKDPGILKLGGPNDGKARPDNEDMLAIEFDNFIKEKSKKLSQSFKPFQIKMKALKINKYFSLKVLDQATVYLIYRDGTTSLKLNIGMVLDHKEIVDTDTAEVGEVSNNMERLPARTDSLAGLQKTIAHSQHYERSRTERELRIRPTVSCGSADRLVSAASRPLRPPLRTGLPGCATDSYCKCSRKPSANNLYYDTRLC